MIWGRRPPFTRSYGRARRSASRSGCTGARSTVLDCVGLVGWAWDITAPTGYALRSSPGARIARELVALGFVQGDGPGAILLSAPGPGQLHLGISTGAGIIHADCAARRVVDRPAPLPWPILAAWIREA